MDWFVGIEYGRNDDLHLFQGLEELHRSTTGDVHFQSLQSHLDARASPASSYYRHQP